MQNGVFDLRARVRTVMGAVTATVVVGAVVALGGGTADAVGSGARVVGSTYLSVPTNWVDTDGDGDLDQDPTTPTCGNGSCTPVMNDISCEAGRGAFVGSNKKMMRSLDGGATWQAVEFGGGGFSGFSTWWGVAIHPTTSTVVGVGAGTQGAIVRSTNMGDTVTATTGAGGATYYGAVGRPGTNHFVAVGDSGRIAFSSNDGQSWSVKTVGSGWVIWKSVDYDPVTGRYWASGTLSSTAWSTDGVNWNYKKTGASLNTIDYDGISAHGGTIIAVGHNGTISRSTNGGSSWSNRGPDWWTDWNDVATNGAGQWTAVAPGGRVYRSTNDGSSWTKVRTPSGLPDLRGVEYC